MTKKLCLVLGNGFSIDLIQSASLDKDIDVMSLFSKGAELPWPGNDEAGFLSFKNCPNLWNLGARPNMEKQASIDLLENIITCVNVHALNNNVSVPDGSAKPNDIYIHAYHELTSYLRALFSYYDRVVPNGELSIKLEEWSWLIFLKHVSNSKEYKSISIITYNYDIWLERVLIENDISFEVSQLDNGIYLNKSNDEPKITIIKPHGSISFYHNTQSEAEYAVGYNRGIPGDAAVKDFKVNYDIPLSKCLINALIPPAGDTERMKQSWSGQIRTAAKEVAHKLTGDDELMVCGISYWHVDRSEVDELITQCSREVNVYMFNPYPNQAMNAVFTSLFKNYVYYVDSKVLKSRIK